MKKLAILGGSRYAIPVIEAAHEEGLRVVTMDYLPGNIAHKFSDEYINVSIVDKEAVYRACSECGVSGVMSFAADPGVASSAYVAERLELPFQGSYEVVSILQNKARFRDFLREHGFNCPKVFSFRAVGEALKKGDELPFPVIVKPADSAGSKGCTRVDDPSGLEAAVEYALSFSISGTCVVEEFIESGCPSSDSDGFTVDGRFQCISFTSQYFDEHAANPYAPAAYGMPCDMPEEAQEQLSGELQRLSDLLNLKTGVYNIETRVGVNGLPYIMELSPRGGGNRLCEMLRYASGVDLIAAAVRAAVGDPVDNVGNPRYDGFWYQQILHSEHNGVFRGIEYAPGFEERHVIDEQVWVSAGSSVNAFSAANHAFGSVFLRFDSKEELEAFRMNPTDSMNVRVDA